MRFLFKWLHIQRPPGVALHPGRTVELAMPAAEAFERSIAGVEFVLGGVVRESDRARGVIEATFGLINSERMTVSIESDGAKSRVVIEARRGVSGQAPQGSNYIDALADYLQSAGRGNSGEAP